MSLLQKGEQPKMTQDVAPTPPASSALPETLSIGQLARVTGETVKTLRYWTNRGLLAAERGENNYRTYAQNAPVRATFIRNGQKVGLRLEAVGRILNLTDQQQLPCDQIEEELEVHLDGIREQIAMLRGLEAKLIQMLASAEKQPCQEREGCRYMPLGLDSPP